MNAEIIEIPIKAFRVLFCFSQFWLLLPVLNFNWSKFLNDLLRRGAGLGLLGAFVSSLCSVWQSALPECWGMVFAVETVSVSLLLQTLSLLWVPFGNLPSSLPCLSCSTPVHVSSFPAWVTLAEGSYSRLAAPWIFLTFSTWRLLRVRVLWIFWW